MKFPVLALQTIAKDVRVIDSMKLIGDPTFFRDVRAVRLQRQVNNAQCDYFLKFLKPLSDAIGFWLIYEIDDVIGYEDIPPYNMGRKAYENEKFFANVKNMLEAADFITVTTETLKEYYIEKFQINNSEKFIVIPNYLPRWWVGETFSVKRQMTQLEDNKKKPRIGFPASSSHFDLDNINGGVDDFTHIIPFIRKTVNKYQWVFIGGLPRQLEDLAKIGKIEVHRGSDLLNYPRELWRKNLQAIVAPLQDNTFNRCKSNIKLLESWALGIPVIVQDLPCYNKYTNMVFNNEVELEDQLNKLFRDKQKYRKIIKSNRDIIDYGDKNSKNGWWIEKNLQTWYNTFAMPQKTLRYDLREIKKKEPEEGIDLDLS